MRLRCMFGYHRWRRVTYVHQPCEHSNREFGRSWAQCVHCPATRGNLPTRWCLCRQKPADASEIETLHPRDE
jgi:hypothetical protein